MTNAREFFWETILQPQSSPGCCSPKGVISGYPGKSKNKASTYESSHQESINPQLLLSPRDCLSPRGLSKMQQYSMDLSLNYSQSNLVYISCIHNPLWQGIQCLSLHVQNHLHLFVLKQHWFNSPQWSTSLGLILQTTVCVNMGMLMVVYSLHVVLDNPCNAWESTEIKVRRQNTIFRI